jgi:hypothetical protein
MSGFLAEPADDWLPAAEVTPTLYAQWRNCRRGDSHSVEMNNPVWEWLIRTRISAYTANRHFQGPDSCGAGPAWCFSRFGQSRTVLPDGRTILVAGEHEDFYDPDFYIYNDVVAWHPDDRIDIYGYPERDFPPTDFHSATLWGEAIILLGSLGYAPDRRPGVTPAFALDVRSLRIDPFETSGENPGWIFRHRSSLDGDRLTIRRGELQTDSGITESIDDWLLDLKSRQWTRLTDRRWPRFEFIRQDGQLNHLWEMRTQHAMRELQLASIAELPFAPDPQLLDQLYRPAIDHKLVPREEHNFEEHNVYRIEIDGVAVRYVEDSQAIVLTVEGSLPTSILDCLVADVQDKLSRLENAAFTVRRW